MERQHHLTFVVEPELKYLDHIRCGETGLAMAMATMNIIGATYSDDTITVVGAGNKLLNT